MGRWSVLLPVAPVHPEQVRPYVELVGSTSYARLWTGQAAALDPLQAIGHVVGSGPGVPVGTAVMLMPLRSPFDAAMQLRTAALATGCPVIAGFGPGSPVLQRAIRGGEYASPRTAAAEYVRAVRTLLGSDDYLEGQYYPVHVQQPTIEHPPIEIGLGVLRPLMAYTAGQVADVAVTWLAPPAYIRDVLVPELERGARDADRPVPRVVAVVHAAPGVPASSAAGLAYLACAGHLSSPHYADMLTRAGIPTDPRDPLTGARSLVESGTFITGDVAAVASELGTYHRAGVDELVVNVTALNLAQEEALTLGVLRQLAMRLPGD